MILNLVLSSSMLEPKVHFQKLFCQEMRNELVVQDLYLKDFTKDLLRSQHLKLQPSSMLLTDSASQNCYKLLRLVYKVSEK